MTESIPEDVTRAKAGAWLSLISPITQWAGLRGDQLAYKRTLLRIQQDETLAEIVRRARARLQKPIETYTPLPAKFLVPFLEKASLEDVDSELVDLWANLLVSAAEHYNPHFTHFANIISQMSAQQAKLFEGVIGTCSRGELENDLEDLSVEFLHDFVQKRIEHEYKALRKKPKSGKKLFSLIEGWLNRFGLEIEHIELDEVNGDILEHGPPSYSLYKDELETDFAILEATRLLRYIDTGYFNITDSWELKVLSYCVTPLGLSFATACGIVR